MPSRLRPTAATAADAILVGDPGRALLLAQELLEQPKMSNHARGLWGYTGKVAGCRVDHPSRGSKPQSAEEGGWELTIQATGMGGPSAVLVLTDLAALGMRRAVRVGTCAARAEDSRLGELLVVEAAIACGGSAAAHGTERGSAVAPSPRLTAALVEALGEAGRAATIASFDAHPAEQQPPPAALAADMQTAPLLARAASLPVEVGALLIVAERVGGERLAAEALAEAEKRAGRVARAALSP